MDARFLTRSQYVAWCAARWLARVAIAAALAFLFITAFLSALETVANR